MKKISLDHNDIFPFTICLAIPLLAGFIGSIFTTPEIDVWYGTLIKPSFNPPSWLFGPVWTILFLMMGISLFIIWKSKPSREKREAITMFAIQLVFNVAWSFLFFYAHLLLWSLIEILVLLNLIALTIKSFGRISRQAALWLLPYWAWVLFASFLTYSIWRLNW